MNYIIDFTFLLCLGWGAYRGFRKGFIIQSITILSLALATWGGFTFAGKLVPFMQQYFQVSDLAGWIVSFIIVFLLIILLAYISGFIATKLIDIVSLGMINRLSGAVFGVFTNVLILSLLIMLFNRINEKKNYVDAETLEKTYLYKPVEKVAPAIFPENFFEKIVKQQDLKTVRS